jgi:hypothetical protein
VTNIAPLNRDGGIKPLAVGSSFAPNEFFLKNRADYLTRIFAQISEEHIGLST